MKDSPVTCSLATLGEVEFQGIAILRLNGINVDFSENIEEEIAVDLLNQFALGHNPAELMQSDNLFIKEISSLRGTENTLRHRVMLDTAFDRDERLAFDIINQLHPSSYF
jgi:hypothetical protein